MSEEDDWIRELVSKIVTPPFLRELAAIRGIEAPEGWRRAAEDASEGHVWERPFGAWDEEHQESDGWLLVYDDGLGRARWEMHYHNPDTDADPVQPWMVETRQLSGRCEVWTGPRGAFAAATEAMLGFMTELGRTKG